MKSVFDQSTRDELISRINSLNENSTAQWGKMNVYQMVKHCALWEEMLLGRKQYRQSLPGRIFGKIALKQMLREEPMKPNLPTVPSFKISNHSGDLATAKAEWMELINQHTARNPSGFVHPFFGKLSAEQAGCMAYKHIDHHLRQFSA